MKRRLKIVVDENMPLVADTLQDHADLHYYPGRSINKQAVSDADALLIRSVTKVSLSMLKNSSCQFIGTATIGTDHIDQAVKDNNNLRVVSAPGCNAQSVAEYVLSAILHYLSVSKVSKVGKAKSTICDIGKLTVGIVGGGNTGSAVEKTLRLLGFTCMIYDPFLQKKQTESENESVSPNSLEKDVTAKTAYCSWHDILQADIVSLHVPFTNTAKYPTAKMINENNVSSFKAELIINACRGGVLSSKAIVDAALKGKTSFILDVFENEPSVNKKVMDAALICTPHIAGYSRNGKLAGSIQVIKSLCSHFNLTIAELPTLKYTPIDLTSENPQLKLGNGDIKVKKLNSLVSWWKSQVYDITVDDNQFRQSADHFPLAFDQLRKNYQHREEVGFDELTRYLSTI